MSNSKVFLNLCYKDWEKMFLLLIYEYIDRRVLLNVLVLLMLLTRNSSGVTLVASFDLRIWGGFSLGIEC